MFKAQKSRRRAYVIAAVVTSLAGSALHFLYVVLPNPLTALISPINESVWEHLKLLFFPTLAAAALLSLREPHPHRLWSGFFAALLAAPAALTAVYYLLSAGFGVKSTAADIALYFAAMFFGFFLAYRLRESGRLERAAPWLLLPTALYGAALILFTFAAPELPIFRPPA
mgnify:CR=1 FL=1